MGPLPQPGMLVLLVTHASSKMGNREKGAYYFFLGKSHQFCKTLVLTLVSFRIFHLTTQFDLDQRLANIFFKGPDVKYFSLGLPYSVWCVFNAAVVVKSSHRQYINQ